MIQLGDEISKAVFYSSALFTFLNQVLQTLMSRLGPRQQVEAGANHFAGRAVTTTLRLLGDKCVKVIARGNTGVFCHEGNLDTNTWYSRVVVGLSIVKFQGHIPLPRKCTTALDFKLLTAATLRKDPMRRIEGKLIPFATLLISAGAMHQDLITPSGILGPVPVLGELFASTRSFDMTTSIGASFNMWGLMVAGRDICRPHRDGRLFLRYFAETCPRSETVTGRKGKAPLPSSSPAVAGKRREMNAARSKRY